MGSRIEDRLLEILNVKFYERIWGENLTIKVKTAGGEPSSVDKIWGVEAVLATHAE